MARTPIHPGEHLTEEIKELGCKSRWEASEERLMLITTSQPLNFRATSTGAVRRQARHASCAVRITGRVFPVRFR